MLRSFLFAVLTFVALTCAARAQDAPPQPAVLIADQVYITRDRTLVAQGNVEAFQGTTQIRASAIRYNQDTGALTLEGPIVITDGDDSVILADAGELNNRLRSGLLLSARLILNQQLQLAAQQINQVDGRYNQLYKASVTSCRICQDGRPPLWQIRARRIVHDKVEQQLYFDEAQFRILNVPVLYIPHLRLPDPKLKRATGFLAPSIRTTSQLGTGLKLPYFIKLGDHRDLTITPYMSSATRTIELRYRQAFKRGYITFNGALTRDDQRPGKLRGYLIGSGAFDLERDYKLTFSVQATSDRSYFSEYGYFGGDRLSSEITLSRTQRDEYIRASVYNFESLRDGDINDNLPTIVLDGEYEKRLFPQTWGGELRLSLRAHSHRRNSDRDTDGPDADLIVDGRDVARLHGQAEWLRRFTYTSGIVADLRMGASFNIFDITQDQTFPQNHSEVVPHAAVSLRYPMVRHFGSGVTQMLEPVAQLAWTGGNRLNVPNDESTRVEFDEGNLLSLSRFPRPDRRERKTVAAIGVNWTRFDPTGWNANVSVGQVLRGEADTAFSASSGLTGTTSSFLIAGQVKMPGGFSILGRSLIDENMDFAKAELRGTWDFRNGWISGSYIWLDADPAEDRVDAVSEIFLHGNYQINNQWTARADWRFNVADDRAATAGASLKYDNECVTVDLSVWRSYSSSTSVEPTTNIGFNVGLRGFAASTGTERYLRSCRK
ncbi:LPS-assembly protein LptD [Sulfitobacter mediterraneus]|nr:LPS assembly protein LptD [Sulfitobacter mediterraneus]MBM1309132.1 LPS-assembly protein LptD [Sulfitobacter mediterraneus]MBM1313016.1 LPS-assembly protein LptD [Sulfitobacter mediterraneus]MBM1321400.1 LPS-assembly protein LptD [Sulfitobacter mediterraneus]MBM1325287.1 LPS-assembly protein LptD [Sulfitobacter mediterraneus]MBM1396634.1 LPS-assembly protein LptD [Sulfitobacter mediterraneus]